MFRLLECFGKLRLKRLCAPLAVVFSAVAMIGCSGAGGKESSKNSLSGTVTYKGQPVVGELVFMGSDRKEIKVPISEEGHYMIDNLPKGELDILVRSIPKQSPPPGIKVPSDIPVVHAPAGVSPPGKYSVPGNGLKVEVTGGLQTKDLPLE